MRSLLDIVLPQAREKRSHPSADFQVINGVPNADYCHLKAVGFALLGKVPVTDDACVNPHITHALYLLTQDGCNLLKVAQQRMLNWKAPA
ncbi:hypothetical protein EMIT0P291_130082 [Pseudomonas sp. IT-P291]